MTTFSSEIVFHAASDEPHRAAKVTLRGTSTFRTSFSLPPPLELLNNFLTQLRLNLLSIQFTSESGSVSFFSPHPMPEPCCGFSLLLIRQTQARRPSLCDGCRRGDGPAGKGDTPCVRSAIVVVAMVAIVVVAREMAVACLTRPPHAVTGIIDARRCSALWECGREERTTVNEFRRNRDCP